MSVNNIRELPNLVGATQLWVSEDGAWVAGQLPIAVGDDEIVTPPRGSRSPVYLVERARYRLLDRRSGKLSGEQEGLVVAPPTEEGKVSVLRGEPPKLVLPSGSELDVPARPDSRLVHLIGRADNHRFFAVLRGRPDPMAGKTKSWMVLFDSIGAVRWDGTISSLNAIALSGDGSVVAVATGSHASGEGFRGFTFIDGDTGEPRWRAAVSGSWEAVRSLVLTADAKRAYAVSWRDLFVMDLDKQELRTLPTPNGSVVDLMPCGDKLMLLSQQELGGDSAAMYGMSGQGVHVELHEVDVASGKLSPVEERRLLRDNVAAFACHGGELLLPIGSK